MECKYVVVDELGREVRWQEGSNMELCVPGSVKGRPLHRLEAAVSWCKQFKNFLAAPVEGVTVPLTSLDVAPMKHQPQQQVAQVSNSAPVTPAVPAARQHAPAALPSASAPATPTMSVAAAPVLAGVAAAAADLVGQPAAAAPLPAKPSGRSGSPSSGNSFAAFVAARQPSPVRHEQQQQQQASQQASSIFTAPRAVAAEPALPATPTKSSRSASPIGAAAPAASSVVEQPVAAVAASAQTAGSSTSSAAPPTVPSFQLNPPSSEEPMSILLKSGRARSPPVKISLSTSTSLLMEMPSRPPSPALGSSTTASAAISADAGSSSASTSRPSTSELAAPTPVYPGASPRYLAPTSRPGSPSASAITWGQEYDVYAAVYESPYMHTPFDLDAYAMYDAPTAMPSPVLPASASRRSPSPRGALGESVFCSPGRQPSMSGPAAATSATDLLETAVQAARELHEAPSAPPQSQPLQQPAPSAAPAQPAHAAAPAAASSTAAAEPAQAAPSTPPPSPGSPSSFPASFNPFLKDSQLGSSSPKSSNDWAGKTLFELSAGRHAHGEDDEEEEEPADDEAVLSHALAAPTAPSDMAALLKQLGSALGRSVRLRYEGVDSSAEDLLELDRKVRGKGAVFLLHRLACTIRASGERCVAWSSCRGRGDAWCGDGMEHGGVT